MEPQLQDFPLPLAKLVEEMFKNALLIFLGACSFGVLSTFVKIAYSKGYTVGEVTGVQVFFGMLTLWTMYGFGKRLGLVRKDGKTQKHPVWMVFLCGFSTGIVSILYYKSVQFLPASIAIILLMQFVWLGTLIDFLVFKSKPGKWQLISVACVLIGTFLAAGLLNQQQVVLSFKGILFGLLAALSYAVFIMVNGRVGNEYPAVQKSAIMVSGACILVFSVFPPAFLINGTLFGGGLWAWGILLAAFGTVIPPLFFATGIPKVGVPISSILSAVELPVAVGMSYFVLSEKVSVLQWLGVLIILSAIVLANLKEMRAT